MKLNYAQIWRAISESFPDRIAAVSADGDLTYGELADRAGRLCALFEAHGIRPGQRVMLFLHNRAEHLVALFAAYMSGVTPVPVNFRYRARELGELIDDCDAVGLVFAASLAPVVDELGGDGIRLWLRVDDAPRDGTPRDGELSFAAIDDYAPALPADAPASGELFLYTGGTTGRPKAVVWNVAELLDVQMYSIFGTIGLENPTSLDEIVRIAGDATTPVPITMPLAPMMHGTALFTSMNTLVLGGTVVFLPTARLDADAAVDLIRRHGVTRVIVAGDAIASPLADAAERAGARLDSLASVISSGMRFTDAVKARLHALGDFTITDLLASTEGGPYGVAVSTGQDDLPATLTLFPGAVVLDDADEEVQDTPGARGMLGFRGTLPLRYHGDEEKTTATFRMIRGRRHVVAGDLVEVIGDGRIELLGRGSAVVNTGGEKVFPAEVEDVLLAHRDVRDAVVFGTPDERFGEVVTAVVATASSGLTADALRAHCDTLLAGYKKPRVIDIRRSLERSPSGKVDMRRLKSELAGSD
ncbi:MAG: AMP-binding protein [Microbacterium sp.]